MALKSTGKRFRPPLSKRNRIEFLRPERNKAAGDGATMRGGAALALGNATDALGGEAFCLWVSAGTANS